MSVRTDSEARYYIAAIPAGTYAVALEPPGFRSETIEALNVDAAARWCATSVCQLAKDVKPCSFARKSYLSIPPPGGRMSAAAEMQVGIRQTISKKKEKG